MSVPDQNPVTAVGVDFGGTSIKLGVCRGSQLLDGGRANSRRKGMRRRTP